MSNRYDEKYGSHYYFWKYIKENNIELTDKNFLEIGCARQVDYRNERYWEIFDSSGFYYNKSKDYKFNFITVDMDEVNTKMLKERLPDINVVTDTGENFTEHYDDKLDFLYLDAFDYEKDTHSNDRRDRYREVMDKEITNEQCWKMHLDCCKNLISKLNENALVCFDDVFDNEVFDGKGRTAIPFLLDNGFEEVLYKENPGVLILRKKGDI